MNTSYDDILQLSHPTSKTHPRMSRTARAAQFSPFAALTGYEAAIKETARLTDQELDLDDTMKAELNEKLSFLKKHLKDKPQISITFFVPDTKKTGGAYKTTTGWVKKILEYEKRKRVYIDRIISGNSNTCNTNGNSSTKDIKCNRK